MLSVLSVIALSRGSSSCGGWILKKAPTFSVITPEVKPGRRRRRNFGHDAEDFQEMLRVEIAVATATTFDHSFVVPVCVAQCSNSNH